MKKINVLQLLTTSNVRGSESLVVNMVEQGDSNKYNYLICTLYPTGDLQKITYMRGVQFFSLGIKVNFILAAIRLWNLLNTYEIDIVHVYGFRTDILCRLVLLFSKVKVFVSAIHSVYSDCPKTIFIIDKLLSPLVDLYISNSIRGAEFHQLKTNIDKSKYFVSHSGINTSVFKQDDMKLEKSEFRNKTNISSNSLIITLLAGITGQKGHDIAVEAFARIKNIYPEIDCKLVFAGKDYVDGAIQHLSFERDVNQDVLFLGFCDSEMIHQVMSATDIFILPSLREGFPTVVLEAMSYGLPVVASDVGGTSELLVNGKTGFLVIPADLESLIEKLSVLIEDESQRIEMGEAGRKLVETKFSLEQMTSSIEQKYFELYQQRYG
jgi:glycosyltransferase involved in cell wall biosynthesis